MTSKASSGPSWPQFRCRPPRSVDACAHCVVGSARMTSRPGRIGSCRGFGPRLDRRLVRGEVAHYDDQFGWAAHVVHGCVSYVLRGFVRRDCDRDGWATRGAHLVDQGEGGKITEVV